MSGNLDGNQGGNLDGNQDPSTAPVPALALRWGELASPATWPTLAAALLQYVRPRRWFRAKARRPRGARILDVIPLDGPRAALETNLLALVEIWYEPPTGDAGVDGNGDRNGDPGAEPGPGDVYVVALACVVAGRGGSEPPGVGERRPGQRSPAPRNLGAASTIATCREGVVVDGLATGHAADALLALVRDGRVARGADPGAGELRGETSPALDTLSGGPALVARVPRVEQTNSTLMFGDRILLKIYREVTAGPSPELEVGRFLTASCDPPCTARVLGALSYHAAGADPRVVGIAHEFIANQGDAWSLARRELDAYFDRVAVAAAAPADPARAGSTRDAPAGRFAALAETLGRRTAEMHLALAGLRAPAGHDPWRGSGDAFRPRPLTAQDRTDQAARVGAMLDTNLAALAASARTLGPTARELARTLLVGDAARVAVTQLLARFRDRPLDVQKTRTHGDLHLGQVLALARDDVVDDFLIIDFEGEPARPLAERRTMSSPIRDVMGMVRSFDYAPEAALRERTPVSRDGDSHSATLPRALQAAAARWTGEVTARYLAAYRALVGDAPFMPRAPEQLSLLLNFYQLEKVVYELGYEINNRPDWVEIPLRGLARVVATHANETEGSAGP